MQKLLLFLLLLIPFSVSAQTSGSVQPPATTTLQSAASTNANGTTLNTRIFGAVKLSITISGTATVNFEGRLNSSGTFKARTGIAVADTAGTLVTTTATTGDYIVYLAGDEEFRARISGCSGCGVTVIARPIPSVGKAIPSSGGGGGSVTDVSGTSPIASSGGTTPAISCPTCVTTADKDSTGGYAGLTLFKIDFKNAANTFTSFFTNTNTAARTYTFQDRNGTIADDTDLAAKQNTITFGTGVQTALSVNIGSAGAPVLFNGALGTPSSGVATNLTGTASGLTAGNVTTNANLTGPITSVGNATSIASQTGTGTKFVVDTSPTLVTPVLGAATYTTLNGGNITDSALTAGRVTFAGTVGLLKDASSLTFTLGDGSATTDLFTLAPSALADNPASTGASATATLNVTGTAGQSTSFSNNLSRGGLGAPINIIAGVGGANSDTNTNSSANHRGGNGGILTLRGGGGGAGTNATGVVQGGSGGGANLYGGNGGSAVHAIGGQGGSLVTNAGDGGASTTTTGGLGGIADLSGGNGGVSSAAAVSGAGGLVDINGGIGGANSTSGGTAGNGGDARINAGQAGSASGGASAGTDGIVYIGNLTASAINIGKAAVPIGITGNVSLASLTSNGFVKTGGGTGALSIDTTTYATDSLVVHLAGTESISGAKTYAAATLKQAGAGAGVATLAYANTATNSTLTLPTSATDTLAALGLAQSWTANQTFGSGNLLATAPVFTTNITTPAIITASGALTLTPASNAAVLFSTTERIQIGGTTNHFQALRASTDSALGYPMAIEYADDSALGILKIDQIYQQSGSFNTAAATVRIAANFIQMSSVGIIGFTSASTITTTSPTVQSAFSQVSSGVIGVGTGAQGNTAGALLMYRKVTAKTGDYTVVAADSNTFFTNTGASAGINFTLPTAVVGQMYEFYRDANQTVTITAGASTTIRVGSSVTASAGNVTLDAVGSKIRLTAISTTQWVGDITGSATFN